MQYSEGKFGIKVQEKICRDLGWTKNLNHEIWNSFGDRVGWRVGGKWLDFNEVAYHTTTQPKNGYFPIILYSRRDFGCGGWVLDKSGFMGDIRGPEVLTLLFSRVKT